MAETQMKHRQDLEKRVIDSDIGDSRLGLFLGFIVAIVAILAGAYCIVNGHSIAGGILGSSAVPGLVGVFVYGSKQRRKEREAKIQQLRAAQQKDG